jgi:hypothetical protein
MRKVRSAAVPFKTYTQLAWRLSSHPVLDQERPPTCRRCGEECGFVKAGFYRRAVVFLSAVVTGVAVQRYECKKLPNATFSVLPHFQERLAHYSTEVRGAVLDRVFSLRRSIRAAWLWVRAQHESSSLARSTASSWCQKFREHGPGHAAALGAHLSKLLPHLSPELTAEPGAFLAVSRAAFRLYRSLSHHRFWEWLHALLLATSGRRLLSA